MNNTQRFKTMIVNGKVAKVQVWDTAGQERYRSLAKVFYKSANVCILVYDITRKESFDELKEYKISTKIGIQRNIKMRAV